MYGFDKFPYANFHEINIDWLLQKVKGLESWASQFDVDAIKAEIDIIIHEMLDNGEFDSLFEKWIEPIQGDVADLENRVSTLETTQTAQDGLINGLGTDVDSLDTRVTALENGQSGQGGDITALTTRVTNLETNYTTLSGTVTNLGDELTLFETSTTASLGDLNTRVTALETAVPAAPNWHNRNKTYGGTQYNTIGDLRAAIEGGTAFVGDYCVVNTLMPTAGAPESVQTYVYVAKLRSETSAFLLVYMPTENYVRDTPTYSTASLKNIIAGWCSANYGSAFGGKLKYFNTGDTAGNTESVLGALLTASQAVGFPAYPPTDMGQNITGALEFIHDYLRDPDPLQLMDSDGTNFALLLSTSAESEGYIVRSTTDTTTPYKYAFTVLYN